MAEDKIFQNRSIVVYLSYAPAGFGHLRVADALYHGLPEYVTPILLGTSDTSVTFLHRLTSVHPLFRALFVWGQSGVRERVFTVLYRRYLHKTAHNIKHQLVETIEQRIDPVDTIVIVSTHFGIAHQVAYIKKELEKTLNVKIILAVVVTDDSPQLIWYVHHADLMFVPSDKTAEVFKKYDTRKTDLKPKIKVIPYPISPTLGQSLSGDEFENRKNQVDPLKERDTNMIIPLSGAAVGTKTMETIISELKRLNKRFTFGVLVKDAPYTKLFINRLEKHSAYIKVYKSKNDKEIVDMYERIYMRNVVSLEITKPSEQAFKALYYPRQRGGSVLLFAAPVGRQEFDNLDFLQRHKLLPTNTEHKAIWELAKQKTFEKETMYTAVLNTCHNWRGLILPSDPVEAARFIEFCMEHKIFLRMMNHEKPRQSPPHNDHEISSDGVAELWKTVENFVKNHQS